MDDYSTINCTNIGENSSKCDSPTQNRASALIAGLSLIEKNACKTPAAATTVSSQKRRAVALRRP
uniref:Uncharacterized protein n=1 Tax=Romanomermis culicivorax TaxID=13658 RepID=A0A915I2T3_ROMCU